MKTQSLTMGLAFLVAAFMWGCQEQGSGPVAPEGLGVQLDPKSGDPPIHHHGDDALTFTVTVKDADGSHTHRLSGATTFWTDGAQDVQTSNAKNRLHVFDSGGNGTRGKPNYANAAFSTQIFLKPLSAAVGTCAKDPANMLNALRDELFGKFDQGLRDVVFDFQISHDLATNPTGFLFFLFRWKVGGRIFSVEIGAFPAGDSDRAAIAFSGAGAIDDPTKTRVFSISGGKAIARELDKNKVIATLACPNEHTIEVTVDPV